MKKALLATVVLTVIAMAQALQIEITANELPNGFGDNITEMAIGLHTHEQDFYKDNATGAYIIAEEGEVRLYIRDGTPKFQSLDLLRDPGSILAIYDNNSIYVNSSLVEARIKLDFTPSKITIGGQFDSKYKVNYLNVTYQDTVTAGETSPPPAAYNCTERRTISKQYETIAETYEKLDALNLTKYSIGKTELGKEIWAYETGEGPSILSLGRLHGIEDCGTQNALLLARNPPPEVRLILIPSLNLDNPFGRVNANSVDLNRNFPTNWQQLPNNGYSFSGIYPASEKETKALIDFLNKTKPDAFVDVHCGQRLLRWMDDNAITRKINLSDEAKAHYGARKIGSSANGYAFNEAKNYAKASFLLETDSWDELPSTTVCYEQEEWPLQREIYNKIAEAIR